MASHIRSLVKGGKTTCPEHMPKSHQEQAKLSVEAMQEWAAKNGPATKELFERILIRQRQSESALHSFVGIFRLAKRYGQQRTEKPAVARDTWRADHRRCCLRSADTQRLHH